MSAYGDALTIFRRYLTDTLSISIADFRFTDLTYDFLLDYRIHLENKRYKPRTINHRLAAIAAYMHYAASRKVELAQIYLNVSEVPYVTVPSRIMEIIEDKGALEAFLAAPRLSRKGIRSSSLYCMIPQ